MANHSRERLRGIAFRAHKESQGLQVKTTKATSKIVAFVVYRVAVKFIRNMLF